MEFTAVYPQLRILPNAKRAKNTVLLFRIVRIVILLSIVLNISTILSIKEGRISQNAVVVNGLFAVLSYIPYMLLGIFFILWMQRAYHNLHQAGVKDLEYTPGWSVAGWFVPIANLFVPYKIVSQTWNETQQTFYKEPITEIYEGSIINYWWGTYIGASVVAFLGGYYLAIVNNSFDGPPSEGNLIFAYGLITVSNLLLLFSAFYGAKMVRDLSTYEEEMMQRAKGMYDLEIANAAERYLGTTTETITESVAADENEEVIDEEKVGGEFTENAERSMFLKIGLYALLFVAFAFGALWYHIYSASNMFNYWQTMYFANPLLNKISWAGFIVFCVTGLIGMAWMNRAYSNLYTLGVKGLSFKRGMAIYGWLIPFGNLIIPYIILSDINRFTQIAVAEKENGPSKEIANKGLLLGFWISCVLSLYLLYLNYASVRFMFSTAMFGAFCGILSAITGMIALWLGATFVNNIAKVERELLAIVEKRFGEEENVTEEKENNSNVSDEDQTA